MLATEILEIQFDFTKVGFHVAARLYHPGTLDEFALVVNAIKQNGQMGFLGDDIETFLPG